DWSSDVCSSDLETIDASQKQLTAFYEKNKTEIQWTDEFDVYARAAVDYPFHSIREIYPVAHQMRTGNAVFNMPPDYYTYRKSVDYNNKALAHYSPYVAYLSHMLNNLASGSAAFSPGADQVLRANISKIKIADTLIKDASIKNTVINNIAFTYLLEDQNMINNQKFLQTYHAISTDTSQHNEITKIGNAIMIL